MTQPRKRHAMQLERERAKDAWRSNASRCVGMKSAKAIHQSWNQCAKKWGEESEERIEMIIITIIIISSSSSDI